MTDSDVQRVFKECSICTTRCPKLRVLLCAHHICFVCLEKAGSRCEQCNMQDAGLPEKVVHQLVQHFEHENSVQNVPNGHIHYTVHMEHTTEEWRARAVPRIIGDIEQSTAENELPQTILDALAAEFGTDRQVWFAYVQRCGGFSAAVLEGVIQHRSTRFGVWYTDLDSFAINDGEVKHFLKQKATRHQFADNPSQQIANEAADVFGGLWLCVHGKRGTVFARCSQLERQLVRYSLGEVDFILAKWDQKRSREEVPSFLHCVDRNHISECNLARSKPPDNGSVQPTTPVLSMDEQHDFM